MKIALIEPLKVSEDLLKKYKEKIEDKGHQFKYYLEKAKNEEEQKERIKDQDIVIIANSPLSGNVIKSSDKLKYIDVAFTGFDHVDMDQANEQNIKVSNAAGYADTSVKELVIAMVLNIYRKINKGNDAVREGKTHEDYYTGHTLKGKTVGIIGTGNIGSEVAKLFLAFDTTVIAYSRSEKDDLIELGVEYKSFEDVMSQSDIITIHLPLNSKTEGIVDKSKLKLMKSDAIFINCSRGPIVDNDYLSKALNNDEIAYAGIDVFNEEPPLSSDTPLLNAKNTLLQPHIAYLTEESMIKRAEIAFDNVFAYLEDKPQNLVN